MVDKISKLRALLSQPIVAQLLVMSLLMTIFNIVRFWLGIKPSMFFGLMSGLLAYFLAVGFLLDAPEKRSRILKMKGFIGIYWKHIIIYGLAALVFILFVVILKDDALLLYGNN